MHAMVHVTPVALCTHTDTHCECDTQLQCIDTQQSYSREQSFGFFSQLSWIECVELLCLLVDACLSWRMVLLVCCAAFHGGFHRETCTGLCK